MFDSSFVRNRENWTGFVNFKIEKLFFYLITMFDSGFVRNRENWTGFVNFKIEEQDIEFAYALELSAKIVHDLHVFHQTEHV
jgi:hypothetical protein